jgi:hypothetical protein
MSTFRKIHAPAAWDGSEGLLAIIVPACYRPPGISFVTAAEEPLQVGCLSFLAGCAVGPHVHLPVRRVIDRTQEVLIVRSGRVQLDVYTSAGMLVEAVELGAGDLAVLVTGGHGLTVPEDSELWEVKQGPYLGRDRDKTALTVKGG